MNTTGHWYVVRTHPRAEARAIEQLRQQGFIAYLPKLLKQRRHARKIETVSCPLFPRYLFVLVDITTQRWRAIRSTSGVTALLGGVNGPVPVQPGIVEALREQEDADGFFHCKTSPFARGAAIRVVDGLFASCNGFFETMSDNQRVAILLDLLGRPVRVVLDARSVTAA
jgi:transcriptional antiterminator RfaH